VSISINFATTSSCIVSVIRFIFLFTIITLGDCMATITVRIDEDLRDAMRKLRYVNWGEVVREAIRRRVKEEGSRNLAEAVLLNERLRRKAPEGWNSAKVIRELRLRK